MEESIFDAAEVVPVGERAAGRAAGPAKLGEKKSGCNSKMENGMMILSFINASQPGETSMQSIRRTALSGSTICGGSGGVPEWSRDKIGDVLCAKMRLKFGDWMIRRTCSAARFSRSSEMEAGTDAEQRRSSRPLIVTSWKELRLGNGG